MPKQYTLYLSTSTSTTGNFKNQAPTSVFKTTDNNNATWLINWDSLFGIYKTGKMKVKYQFQSSTSSASFTYDQSNGTIRAFKGLSSDTQNVYNGLVLGMFNLSTNTLPATDGFLYGETVSSLGVECNIPKGYSDFCIGLVNSSETQISTTLDWNIILYFELEDKFEKLGE